MPAIKNDKTEADIGLQNIQDGSLRDTRQRPATVHYCDKTLHQRRHVGSISSSLRNDKGNFKWTH